MRALAIAGGLLLVAVVLLSTTVRFTRATGPQARSPSGRDADARGAGVSAGILLAVPVVGVARASIADSWGDPRDNGERAHHGTDIMAAAGSPVIAAAPGRVEKLHQSAAGGITAYVRSPAGKWSYYYAHLMGYAPGLHEGQPVRAGDPIGYVGDTGNAGAGNYHLHFGLSRMRPGDRWWQGQPVDPYPLLAGTAPGR